METQPSATSRAVAAAKRCSSPIGAARLVTEGLGVSLLPRLLVQRAIETGGVVAPESGVALHPSRMFAVYRFAESSRFIQEMIDVGHRVMAEARLIEGAANASADRRRSSGRDNPTRRERGRWS
jgi:DNA-binding transcriptional LysR family regulator